MYTPIACIKEQSTLLLNYHLHVSDKIIIKLKVISQWTPVSCEHLDQHKSRVSIAFSFEEQLAYH